MESFTKARKPLISKNIIFHLYPQMEKLVVLTLHIIGCRNLIDQEVWVSRWTYMVLVSTLKGPHMMLSKHFSPALVSPRLGSLLS